MKSVFVLLSLCLASCLCEGDVVEITSASDLEAFIGKETTLIEFYAPWCGHCKKLLPEFESAAETLKENDLKLAKVDCTTDGNKELCRQYGVEGYPTIKFFRDGEASDYSGGREAEDIVKFMLMKTGPSVKECEADEACAQALVDSVTDNDLVVIEFAEKLSDEFKKEAELLVEDFSFGSVTDKKVAEALGASFPSVTMFRTFDEEQVVFDGGDLADDFKAWANKHALPALGEIGPENYGKYMARELPLAWIAVNPDEEDHIKLLEDCRKIVGEFADVVSVVSIDGVKFAGHLKSLGVTEDTLPQVLITKMNDKYRLGDEEITADSVKALLEGFRDGKLEKFLKSAEPPTDNDGPVTVIVGKTFDELVANSKKDVLLELYAPWCGHCKQLEPEYNTLGERFADNDNIVIAKVDATENDVPVEIQGFPTMFLFSPSFEEPLEYSGGRTADDLEAWINTNAPSLQADDDDVEGHDEL